MYRNGGFVTLAVQKTYNDGSEETSLPAGTAGMIVQVRRVPAGRETEYVVEFGAYGQWNCYHRELSGEDILGLEIDEDGEERVAEEPAPQITIRPRVVEAGHVYHSGDFLHTMPMTDPLIPEEDSDEIKKVDPEADMNRRIAQLEKERK